MGYVQSAWNEFGLVAWGWDLNFDLKWCLASESSTCCDWYAYCWLHYPSCDLIYANIGEWRHFLIRSVFHDLTTTFILSIPLPLPFFPYRHWWFFNASGFYSLRSGYKLLLCGRSGMIEDHYSTIPIFTRFVFNKLWGASVLEKMKVHCWRFLNNFLLTKANLFQRRIGADRMCLRCGMGPETILHAGWDCPSVLQLWHTLEVSWVVHPDDTPLTWLHIVFQTAGERVYSVILTIWATWYCRNQIIHEGTYQTVQQIHTFILGYMWKLHIMPLEPTRLVSHSVWTPTGWYWFLDGLTYCRSWCGGSRFRWVTPWISMLLAPLCSVSVGGWGPCLCESYRVCQGLRVSLDWDWRGFSPADYQTAVLGDWPLDSRPSNLGNTSLVSGFGRS